MEKKDKQKKYKELLKLQEKYRKGEIKAENISLDDLRLLSKLYDMQIENLEKSNKDKEEKLLLDRKKYMKK